MGNFCRKLLDLESFCHERISEEKEPIQEIRETLINKNSS